MRMYYYKYLGDWFSCRAKNKAEAGRILSGSDVNPDKVLTEREAYKRAASGDKELADYMKSTYMCVLMCN